MQSLACLHDNALIKRYRHSLEYISYQGCTFLVDLYELYMKFNIIKCIIKNQILLFSIYPLRTRHGSLGRSPLIKSRLARRTAGKILGVHGVLGTGELNVLGKEETPDRRENGYYHGTKNESEPFEN